MHRPFPDAFMKILIILILKNKNSDTIVESNYRTISIVAAMAKLF